MSTTTSTGGQRVVTDDQRTLLEKWLLDDTPTLTYEEARARMLREFGLNVSYGSIVTFYQQRSQERMLRKLTITNQTTATIRDQFGDASPKVFDALLEMGGLAAIDAQLQSGNISLNHISKIVELATLGLKARNQAAQLRLRERAQALREKMYQDSLRANDPIPAQTPPAPPPLTAPAPSTPPPAPASSNHVPPPAASAPAAPPASAPIAPAPAPTATSPTPAPTPAAPPAPTTPSLQHSAPSPSPAPPPSEPKRAQGESILALLGLAPPPPDSKPTPTT